MKTLGLLTLAKKFRADERAETSRDLMSKARLALRARKSDLENNRVINVGQT